MPELLLDYDLLTAERRRQPIPIRMSTFEGSVKVLKKHLSPWLKKRLQQIDENPLTRDHTSEQLRSFRQLEIPALSRPNACAIYVYKEAGELYKQSAAELCMGNPATFSICFDLAEQVSDTALCIIRGEGVFMRGAKQEALQALGSTIKESDITPEQATRILERGAERFQTYADLLKEDPSGVHVMHYQTIRTINGLFGFPTEEDSSTPGGYTLAVKLLGEVYATAVYRTIYPLSGN